MKTTISKAILFLFSFVLLGCPFESEVPIDQPQVKVDKAMLGKWIDQDQVDGHHGYLVIVEADKKKYQIDLYSWEKDHFKRERFFGFTSLVGDQTFMNVQGEGKTKYSLYKYVVDGKTLTVFEVTDNIDETFRNSEDLKAFIKKNMNLSFFYNKDETIFRKAEE